MDNGFGGKEYRIDKKRIPMPRAPRKLSAEVKAQRAKQLADARQKRILSAKTLTAINNSDAKDSSKSKSTSKLKELAKTT